MMLNLLSVVGNDKFIEHPVLGSVSCSGMYEAFKRCNELLNTSGSLPIQCRSLHDISKIYRLPLLRKLMNRSHLLQKEKQ